jgi:hypothetical protein
MTGFVLDEAPISVDFWTRKKTKHVKHYFLTHAHTDHMDNLSQTWNTHVESFRDPKERPLIYCSKVF